MPNYESIKWIHDSLYWSGEAADTSTSPSPSTTTSHTFATTDEAWNTRNVSLLALRQKQVFVPQ